MSIFSHRNRKVAEDASKQAAALAANAAMHNIQSGTNATVKGMDLFRQAAQSTTKVAFDQRKGNLFEYIEAAKFNRYSANGGFGTRAIVTAADGRPHDPSDIDLVDNTGKLLKQVQAKVMDTHSSTGADTSAASSVFHEAGGNKGHWGKYQNMQRLIRKEDSYKIDPNTGEKISLLDEAKKLAENRGNVAGGLHADDYQDVAENLTDELTDDTTGVKSGGTTLSELKRASDNPEKYARRFEMEQYVTEVGSSAVAGAASGAIMAGVVSSITSSFDVYNDQKSLSEAAKEVGKAVAKGTARGGATGALSAVLRIGATKNNIPVISDSTASTVIAGSIIDTGVSIYAYAQGEISAEELRNNLADTVIKSTVTIYMTKAAALALGSCGAFVPMAIYSISSYMVACTREIIKNAELNATEYRRLASLLDEETSLIYRQKAIMETQLKEYTVAKRESMGRLLNSIDSVMIQGGNYDMAINSIVLFANETGIELQHINRSDFDAAMMSDDDYILK